MSSAARLPLGEMPQPQRSSSTDSTADSIRKRVCKACDRCRLKKSKCDGASPCSRCKADNAICVFGERKKSHDKVYPKGYVEMLEQQQGQLVSGLQEMYRRLLQSHQWESPALSESSGHPLTHDILAALNLLETKHDGSGDMETFEEDCEKLQSTLFKAGAPRVRRKGSFSSDSDHSQHGNGYSTTHSTPNMTKPTIFRENFSFSSSPSPVTQSPMPRKRQSYPPAHQSPLHQSTQMPHDPQLYQHEWNMSELANPEVLIRSKYAMQPPQLQQTLDDVPDLMSSGEWNESSGQWDSLFSNVTSYPAQFPSMFNNMPGLGDMGASTDPMEIEFNRWISVST